MKLRFCVRILSRIIQAYFSRELSLFQFNLISLQKIVKDRVNRSVEVRTRKYYDIAIRV
jgi:hypothetical protein